MQGLWAGLPLTPAKPKEPALLCRDAADQVYEVEFLNRHRTAARHRQVVEQHRPQPGRVLDASHWNRGGLLVVNVPRIDSPKIGCAAVPIRMGEMLAVLRRT